MIPAAEPTMKTSTYLIATALAVAVPAASADEPFAAEPFADEPFADETAVQTADRVIYHDFDLELEAALFHDNAPTGDNGKDLMLYLGYKDGKVRPRFMAWAGMRRDRVAEEPKSRRYNAMDHEGVVTTAEQQGDTLTLEVELDIHPDPWVPGGKAHYTITLEQDGRSFTGTYQGTFKGQAVEGKAAGNVSEQPWPRPVEGWQPLKPGEHPRLMFRGSDIEAIRRRAATPTGQLIVKRIRDLLGGDGTAFPTEHSTATDAYGKARKPGPGSYTIGHAGGYGMLYQLTGDKQYADLARQAVELSFSGVRDRDQRYSWQNPGGKLRAGPSYAAIAYAYDLCYDAWDEDFRRKVAKALQDKVWNPDADPGEKAMAEPTGGDLIYNTISGQHSPHSNHYGAWNGGGGVAILAILGDPGTDDEVAYRAHRVLMQRAERALEVGYGDSGWFFEGHHGGRLNFNTGLAEYLHALRVAAGLDLVAPFPGGDWLVTKWLYELTRQDGKIRDVHKGIYAAHGFNQTSWSGAGDFSIGFSHVPEPHQPAVLWFYEHVIDPRPWEANDFDVRTLPHRAAWALVTWPIGVEPVNPAEVLPHYLLDAKAGYYVLRSGWTEDGNDWVIAVERGVGMLRGPGVKKQDAETMPIITAIDHALPLADGTAVDIRCPDRRVVADMTGVSGAPIIAIEMPARRDAAPEPAADPTPPADDDPMARLQARFGKPAGDSEDPPPPARDTTALKQDVELIRTKPRVAVRTARVGTDDWKVHTIQSGPAPKLEPTTHEGRPALAIGNRIVTLDDDGAVLLLER